MLDPNQSLPPVEYSLMPSGPFSRLTGPHYFLERDGVYAMLIHIEDRHLDDAGVADCGMLITISDNANTGAAELLTGGAPVVTVSLNCDYTASAGTGWLAVEARVSHRSGDLLFTNCDIRSGRELVMTSSAICKIQAAR